MAAYGFTPKRIQQGQSLLNHTLLLDSAKDQHYDDARRMSLQIEKDIHATCEVFKDHIAIAKAVFRKEPHVVQDLKIKKISGGRWACIRQAIVFYNKAPMYMERLQQYGIIQESFQQNKAAAEALLALKAQRLKKKGDAENSTQVKDKAVRELRAWYGEFRKLARIAFQDTPQTLETFGIVVPSSKRKRKEVSEKQA